VPQLTREIKRRIKSIGNTKKITKAMELVSAAKMRKAVNNVLTSRAYADLAWNAVLDLAARTESKYHPLLIKREVNKIGLVLITSNRGLCGSFNHQIINKTIAFIKQQKQNNDLEIELILIGKKGREVMLKRKYSIIAEFPKLDITTQIEEIRSLSHLVIEDYLANKYDEVVIAYTDFISSLSQKPRILQLLPLEPEKQDEYLGEVESAKQKGSTKSEAHAEKFEYLFEPSAEEVLSAMLPRLIEVKIYQAILESDASEHSARMMAMQNASLAASDMIDSLTLAYNQARQAAITTELADISGGKAALE